MDFFAKIRKHWVAILPFPLPQHQHTFLSETTFRPGLPWSSSGRNEQNEISLTYMYMTKKCAGADMRERKWYYHDNPARENLFIGSLLKGEVRRKMNFTYVLGFVVLRDVVKVFPVSSSSFARKKTGAIEHEVTRGHDAA